MTAIHGAECSGNVWAVGPVNNDGSRDYGAFQINAVYPPQNWADYFVNTAMAYELWRVRGYLPWYGMSRIDTTFGLTKHPTWTYRDWAQAGYDAYQRELEKGYPLVRIASAYFLEESL